MIAQAEGKQGSSSGKKRGHDGSKRDRGQPGRDRGDRKEWKQCPQCKRKHPGVEKGECRTAER
eukprot:2271823-Rhodomonas_salina.1